MNQTESLTNTGSMPISMAVNSNINPQHTTGEIATEGKAVKKDRTYFSRAIQTATITLYRSQKVVADLLLDAKVNLSPEEFQKFIREDCQFDFSLVCKFINMASNYTLNDPANEAILPDAWTSRYEIMLMKESTFRIGVTKGIIRADCKLADLRKFREQIEGKKGKAKNPKAKQSASPATAEQPKPTSAKPSAQPGEESQMRVEKAAVKPPVNTSALQMAKGVSAAEPAMTTAAATATAPAKGRIKIAVPKEIGEQHKAALGRLKGEIEVMAKAYDFISAVELEVAA